MCFYNYEECFIFLKVSIEKCNVFFRRHFIFIEGKGDVTIGYFICYFYT